MGIDGQRALEPQMQDNTYKVTGGAIQFRVSPDMNDRGRGHAEDGQFVRGELADGWLRVTEVVFMPSQIFANFSTPRGFFVLFAMHMLEGVFAVSLLVIQLDISRGVRGRFIWLLV